MSLSWPSNGLPARSMLGSNIYAAENRHLAYRAPFTILAFEAAIISTMNLSNKIRTIFRGDISLADLPREALRRKRAAERQREERSKLEQINAAQPRLTPQIADLGGVE